MRMFICPGCQGPNVSTQAEGNLHLLLNAESCALWLVCELWGLQVKNLLCRVSVLMNEEFWQPWQKFICFLSGCMGTRLWTMHSTLSSHSCSPFHRFSSFAVIILWWDLNQPCLPRRTCWTIQSCLKPTMSCSSALLRITWPSLPPLNLRFQEKSPEAVFRWSSRQNLLFPAGSCINLYSFRQVFLYILASISEGLQALGGNLNYFTGAGDKLQSVLNLESLTLNTASFSSSEELPVYLDTRVNYIFFFSILQS